MYTLPPSTTLPFSHLQNYIRTITYRKTHHPSITNYKDYRFSHERRRRQFVASKPKNSCFTWSLTHPATTLTFSLADALFMDHKVHNSSSSLCSWTRKIIDHSEWC